MESRHSVRPAIVGLRRLDDLDLHDLEAVRLLLRGGSVVDWHHLNFSDHAAVDRFLRINEFDPDIDDELARLDELRFDAVDYLTQTLGLQIPNEIAEDVPARDLFLIASRKGPNQRHACVVLKVMHIVHHIAGRAALVRLPISDDAVFRAIELKVMQVVEELRAVGAPIVEFEWSRKTRASEITKLLAKRANLAAKIYDKLRFRLTVAKEQDLIPTLSMLLHQLIPFNYIVPGESVNHLVHFGEATAQTETLKILTRALQPEYNEDGFAVEDEARAPLNEFSAEAYRIINFVADMPLRIDAVMPEGVIPSGCGHVVFMLTEFQLADKETVARNDDGDASHEAYKARQLLKVRERLLRGVQE